MLDAVIIDHQTKTIRPAHDVAEEFFGVAPLTNGTAAACRRQLVNAQGYEWRRSNGCRTMALQYEFRSYEAVGADE
jgi:hypothetical protein